MKRSNKPTAADIVADLTALKLLIKAMNGAMPSLAAELRRDACERIDDIITDIGEMKR